MRIVPSEVLFTVSSALPFAPTYITAAGWYTSSSELSPQFTVFYMHPNLMHAVNLVEGHLINVNPFPGFWGVTASEEYP